MSADLRYCLLCGRPVRSDDRRAATRAPRRAAPALRHPRPVVVLPLLAVLVVVSVVGFVAARTPEDAEAVRAIQGAAVDITYAKLVGDVFLAADGGKAIATPTRLDAAASTALEGQRRLRDLRTSAGVGPYREAVASWATDVIDGLRSMRVAQGIAAERAAWESVEADPPAFTVSLSDADAGETADVSGRILADALVAAKNAAQRDDVAALWRVVAQIDVQRAWLQALLRSEPASARTDSYAYVRGPGLLYPLAGPSARCFRGTATRAEQSCKYAYGSLLEWGGQAREAVAGTAQGDAASRDGLDKLPPPAPPVAPPTSDYQARVERCVKAGGTWTGTPLGGGEYCQMRGASKFALNPFGNLPNGTIGQAYSTTVAKTATGGTASYRFYEDPTARGLPLGLTLGDDGSITGTPTVAVNARRISICAVDRSGMEACAFGTLTIADVPLVYVPGQRLPDAMIGVPYSSTLCQPASAATPTGCGTRAGTATNPRGGTPPYVFSGPKEPAWFTIDPNGTLHGTPPETASGGTYTVCAQDSSGRSQCGAVTVQLVDSVDLDELLAMVRTQFAAQNAPVRIGALSCDKTGRTTRPASSSCSYTDSAGRSGTIALAVNTDNTWRWTAQPTQAAQPQVPAVAAPPQAPPAAPVGDTGPVAVALSTGRRSVVSASGKVIWTWTGTASGPVGAKLLADSTLTCSAWTNVRGRCERSSGQPSSTNWTAIYDTGCPAVSTGEVCGFPAYNVIDRVTILSTTGAVSRLDLRR